MTEKRIWWISVFFCSFFIFAGDLFLFNFFYIQDNHSESDQDQQYRGTWTQALIQNAAFPILIPLFFIFSSPEPNPQRVPNQSNNGWFQVLTLYVSLGVLVSVYSKLYAMEKLYIGWGVLLSTQWILTSLFSPFINRLKFNRWIIISIFLTPVAHFLDGRPAFSVKPDEHKYDPYDKKAWLILIFPSLAFSLSLCLMKFGFEKVLVQTRRYGDRKVFWMVLEMQICVSFIATLICTIGLFASGEYKEMTGKTYDIMSLVGLALSWQTWMLRLLGLVLLCPVYLLMLFTCVLHRLWLCLVSAFVYYMY